MEKQQYEAFFEDGVFKPVEAVTLRHGTKVVVSVEPETTNLVHQDPIDAKIFSILARRYNSGQSDIAARHNEHQP